MAVSQEILDKLKKMREQEDDEIGSLRGKINLLRKEFEAFKNIVVNRLDPAVKKKNGKYKKFRCIIDGVQYRCNPCKEKCKSIRNRFPNSKVLYIKKKGK